MAIYWKYPLKEELALNSIRGGRNRIGNFGLLTGQGSPECAGNRLNSGYFAFSNIDYIFFNHILIEYICCI